MTKMTVSVIVVVAAIAAGSLLAARAGNCRDYSLQNKVARTRYWHPDEFEVMIVGMADAHYTNDLNFSIILRDGTELSMSNPNVAMLRGKCSIVGSAKLALFSAGDSRAAWPEEALLLQDSASRQFVVFKDRLLAVWLSSGEKVESPVSIRLPENAEVRTFPLSEEDVLRALGPGGRFRNFFRE